MFGEMWFAKQLGLPMWTPLAIGGAVLAAILVYAIVSWWRSL